VAAAGHSDAANDPDPSAANYTVGGWGSGGQSYVSVQATCTYAVLGCSDSMASNYDEYVQTDSMNAQMCQYAGCNDTEAINFDPKVR